MTPRRHRGGGEARTPQVLRVDNLSVHFGGVDALSHVSCVVEPGTTHAVIGPNGAGKSTLINVLSGVYRADAGSVFYGDHDLRRLRPDQIGSIGISRTFQNIALSANATVKDNLMLGRHGLTRTGFISGGFRMPGAVREQRAQSSRIGEIAELVGLSEHLDVRAGHLPYGYQKRVELGRAIGAHPSLLLLDEPVAGMNAVEAVDMAQILGQVQEALGISIVIVEHNMPFVMNLAERITVLDFGICIAEGAPAQVRRDPEVIRAYLGGDEGGAIRGALEREDPRP